MNAVRLERRVWTVLLDQTSLAGVLELGRRETLLVMIGVVLKKRSVSGWLAGRQMDNGGDDDDDGGSDSRVRQQRHDDESRGSLRGKDSKAWG